MGAKRNVDMSVNTDKIKIVKGDQDQESAAEQKPEKGAAVVNAKPKKLKVAKKRSKRYTAARSLVDKTKSFTPTDAVDLVKRATYAHPHGGIVVDLVVKEIGELGKITLPHATGKSIRIAIASDEAIAQIAAGKIDFDVLLSTPAFVPKLAKYAKLLGPKGLMPNPKNGTLTQQPEKVKQELEKGSLNLKTEKKAPLAHVLIGTGKMESKMLVANLEALLNLVKFKLVRAYLSSTMSPSVRLKWE